MAMALRTLINAAIAASLGAAMSLCVGQRAQAQSVFFFLAEPINLELFNTTELPEDGSIITDTTISQSHLTVPSLWWTRQQFASKLLNRWVAFSGGDGSPRRVDLLINLPVWNRMSYVERYSFVNRFGTDAAEFGYNIRVFTPQENLLAAYYCRSNLTTATAPVNFRVEATVNAVARKQEIDRDCDIVLRSSGQGALDARDAPLGGF